MRPRSILRVLAVSLLALVGTAAHSLDGDVSELLGRIRAEGDDVDLEVFDQLASQGDLAALEALQQATDYVDGQQALYAAYGAFEKFAKDEALAGVAIEFLAKEALKDRREEAQYAAVWSLRPFEAAAESALENIVRKHKDEDCRNVAITPLLKTLGKRGDDDAGKLILENALLYYDGQQQEVESALKLCQGTKTRKLMLTKLGDKKTTPDWKRTLVEVLVTDTSDKATKGLLKLLDEGDLDARNTAVVIESMGTRHATRALKPLKVMLKSEEEVIRHNALLAISRILGQDRVWVAKLRAYVKGDDAIMRLGAVHALTEMRVSDSAALIEQFLADPDSRVRSQAVELLASTRSKESVPIFIERLDQEHGPVGLRIARVLRLITGKDFGFKANRWRAWWKAEGAEFTLPSPADALALEFARRKQKDVEGRTQSTFYGLPVLSQNVCFILDTSGSMTTRVSRKKQGTTTDPDAEAEGPMRIEIAKEELTKVLTALSAKTFANIVFFSSDAFAWADELTLMDSEIRKEALDFIERAEAKDSTNVYDGLRLAFADARVDTIYLLTDGSPSSGLITDTERLLEEVEDWNTIRRVQIHCISVGRESDFLRDLAAENGGDYRVAN